MGRYARLERSVILLPLARFLAAFGAGYLLAERRLLGMGIGVDESETGWSYQETKCYKRSPGSRIPVARSAGIGSASGCATSITAP